MKKYQGDMECADFLHVLRSCMGCKVEGCCMCRHVNGECVNWAKEGTCNSYDTFHKEFARKTAKADPA